MSQLRNTQFAAAVLEEVKANGMRIQGQSFQVRLSREVVNDRIKKMFPDTAAFRYGLRQWYRISEPVSKRAVVNTDIARVAVLKSGSATVSLMITPVNTTAFDFVAEYKALKKENEDLLKQIEELTSDNQYLEEQLSNVTRGFDEMVGVLNSGLEKVAVDIYEIGVKYNI